MPVFLGERQNKGDLINKAIFSLTGQRCLQRHVQKGTKLERVDGRTDADQQIVYCS